MKYVFLILAALVSISVAHADSVDQLAGVGLPHAVGQKLKDTMIGVDSSGNIVILVAAGKKAQIKVGGTTAAEFDSSGQLVSATLPAVVTPMTAVTPVSAAALTARVSIMATAAPTFAIVMLPAATSNPNKSFGLYNKSASPVLFHNSGVVGTDSINAAAAGTPYSCATGKFCDCRVIGAGTYMCVAQ